MADKSNRKQRSRKAANDRPKKPYSDFPLSPHACGAWQKKIRGKTHYFGRWGKVVNGKLERIPGDGWLDALTKYKAQADDLHAGRTPRAVSGDDLTVGELANRFLTAKKRKLDSGRLVLRSFEEYRQTTDRLVTQFGKNRLVDDLAVDDFEQLLVEISKTWGIFRVGNEITRVRSVFKFGRENGLIVKPVPYGSEFRKPDETETRKHRAKNKKMLEADELRRLLDAASVQVKAMLLLGLNCGFGNHDVATLPESAVDLDAGIVDFARPKTGIERRCPLWSETVEALCAAIAARSEPRQATAEGLMFLSARGRQLLSGGIAHPVTCVIVDLMKAVGVHRAGLGMYTMRHVFRTIADESLDRTAIDRIMGHADHTMGARYTEWISDERLRRVVEHVRAWLFPPDDTSGKDDQPRALSQNLGQMATDDNSDVEPALRLFVG